jgi:hypothetical protein
MGWYMYNSYRVSLITIKQHFIIFSLELFFKNICGKKRVPIYVFFTAISIKKKKKKKGNGKYV